MKKPIVQGVSVLGLLLGGGGSVIQAQGVNPYGTSPAPAVTSGPIPHPPSCPASARTYPRFRTDKPDKRGHQPVRL